MEFGTKLNIYFTFKSFPFVRCNFKIPVLLVIWSHKFLHLV